MDKENVVYTHNTLLFSHKEEWNHVICSKINGTRGHHVKWNKLDTERQVLFNVLSHVLKLKRQREREREASQP
jgi:hypothetical protein